MAAEKRVWKVMCSVFQLRPCSVAGPSVALWPDKPCIQLNWVNVLGEMGESGAVRKGDREARGPGTNLDCGA